MVDVLRADPGSVGLTTALGWYATKHSAASGRAGRPSAPRRPDRRAGRGRRAPAPDAVGPLRRLDDDRGHLGRDGARRVASVAIVAGSRRRAAASRQLPRSRRDHRDDGKRGKVAPSTSATTARRTAARTATRARCADADEPWTILARGFTRRCPRCGSGTCSTTGSRWCPTARAAGCTSNASRATGPERSRSTSSVFGAVRGEFPVAMILTVPDVPSR